MGQSLREMWDSAGPWLMWAGGLAALVYLSRRTNVPDSSLGEMVVCPPGYAVRSATNPTTIDLTKVGGEKKEVVTHRDKTCYRIPGMPKHHPHPGPAVSPDELDPIIEKISKDEDLTEAEIEKIKDFVSETWPWI